MQHFSFGSPTRCCQGAASSPASAPPPPHILSQFLAVPRWSPRARSAFSIPPPPDSIFRTRARAQLALGVRAAPRNYTSIFRAPASEVPEHALEVQLRAECSNLIGGRPASDGGVIVPHINTKAHLPPDARNLRERAGWILHGTRVGVGTCVERRTRVARALKRREGGVAGLFKQKGILLGFQDLVMCGDGLPAAADVPMYHHHDHNDVVLGSPGHCRLDLRRTHIRISRLTCALPRKLDDLELDFYSDPSTDLDKSGLGLGGAYGAPSLLRSFASLPFPDLDDLELDIGARAHASPRRHSRPRRSTLDAGRPPQSSKRSWHCAHAAVALTRALATANTNAAGGVARGTLEYEPRDPGEAQAREGGGEGGVRCLLVVLRLHFRLYIASAGADNLAEQTKRRREKAEKVGLAGPASVPALVARMILRRHERCVRGLGKGRREGGEPPPTQVPPLPSMEPPPMKLVL
ncbi:hypothetical protein FB451DRAFT_1404277 [Mycena latifolia]|nr:hypothetical protein FB451DRAFT_1404277 [Mycena latifolia]